MSEKIKYWWSEDRQWFCILVNDGNSQATVSLSAEEADALADEAMRTPEYLAMEERGRQQALQILDDVRHGRTPKQS